jgi:ribonuclease P protein component
MLPKKNRADKKTIEKIFKRSFFLSSPNLNFRYFKSKNEEGHKISFIVPKTISKKAVERNSLRRKGYINLQKNLSLIPFPVNGVFSFRKKNIENIENEIKNIFKEISNKTN